MSESPIIYNKPWILQRADPFVCHHTDGYYYFTASVPAYDGICLRRSKTLVGLADAEEVYIWHKHESGPQSIHIWAPELHFINGSWYIYYSGGDQDDIWAIRPYVLACDDADPITGTWRELGKIQRADDDEFSFDAFSLDASVFESNGTWYYSWSEKVSVGKQIANLYIAELETPWKLKTPQVLLSSPSYDWERHGFWVNEGPAFLRRGDKIFLTYSASETGIYYCIGMLTAPADADLTDPAVWHKERFPVLATDADRNIYGPGHNSFTTDESGRTVMIYHARTEAEIVGDPLYNPNRHAMIMPICWTEDGRPIFSYDNC